MFLSFLELFNFRNIRAQGINFSRGITVLWGENGGGKTNILESVYFLSYLRPLRRGGTAQLVTHGERDSFVRGHVLGGGDETRLGVHIKRGGKVTPQKQQVRVNTFREYVGGLHSVAFVPEDIKGLFGAPHGRRRLLDQSAAMVKPLHIDVLLDFMRCLRHRNRTLYLVREGRAKESLLDSFDGELCRLSVELSERRMDILGAIRKRFAEFFRVIDGTADAHIEGDFEFVPAEFSRNRQRDIEKGTSTYGPHRNDFSLILEGRDGRFYASQGRKRIMSIAFKLSQAMLLHDLTGGKPVLLLDDITSEIDPFRRDRLLGIIEDMGFQTIITTTEAGIVCSNLKGESRSLQVQKGAIL